MGDRLFAACLVLSGFCLAAFWMTTIPFDGFFRLRYRQAGTIEIAQLLHLIGGIFGVLGYVAVYLAVRDSGVILAFLALLISVTGMTLFVGDAVIALIIFPVLADNSPNMLAIDGAMFTGRVLKLLYNNIRTHMIGILLLSIAILKSRKLPYMPIIVFGIGGVLMNLPPIPNWHIIPVVGGLFGLASAWIVRLSSGFHRVGKNNTT